MASYKNNNNKNAASNHSKLKNKYGSGEISRNRTSEKPRKEKSLLAPTKVIVRRLPPSMTEETFVESVSPLPDHDYFAFVGADSSLGIHAYCRAYLNFKNVQDVYTFRDKFDGYVFVDQKGNEHPAMVEYAPFQKIPKRSVMKKKDARCGTIDEDADYLAFLESLTKPLTITLPPLEAVLEEIQAQDRELKANNGVIKVKTPLLEYIEQRKAEKQRSKEEKKEERRRKEFERKKAREEERKKKREIRELHREMKKEQREEREMKRERENKDDSSVKVLRPERVKDEHGMEGRSEGRMERPKTERDKERQRREEEKMKQRKEKERLRREKEKEERQRRMEEKAKGRETREEEKNRIKEEGTEERSEEKQPTSKPEGSRSKRYSEGRRKEREKERMREEKEKENKDREEEEEEEDAETAQISEKAAEREEKTEEKVVGRKKKDKDPRVERRIRNKDRPAMALYRPGQSRLSSRMRQDREEGAETSSSSPSPVMPSGEAKKCPSWQGKREEGDAGRPEAAREEEEVPKMGDEETGACLDSAEVKSSGPSKEGTDDEGERATAGKMAQEEDDGNDDEDDRGEGKEDEANPDDDPSRPADEAEAENGEAGTENGDVGTEKGKKYPGVKSMTFRRSVSRE